MKNSLYTELEKLYSRYKKIQRLTQKEKHKHSQSLRGNVKREYMLNYLIFCLMKYYIESNGQTQNANYIEKKADEKRQTKRAVQPIANRHETLSRVTLQVTGKKSIELFSYHSKQQMPEFDPEGFFHFVLVVTTKFNKKVITGCNCKRNSNEILW